MKPNLFLFNSALLSLLLAPMMAAESVTAEPNSSPEPTLLQEFLRPETKAQFLSQTPPDPRAAPAKPIGPVDPEEEEITVTGTRTPRPVKDSAGTISVFDSKYLDDTFVRDIQDLVRYEPGVSVQNRPGRGGTSSINIRGIEGNRVLIQVDGVRVPDIYFNSTRDLVDFDALKRVEIVRGPASTLYGSDAIGGVVSYITKDPMDYLRVFGKTEYFSGKLAYSSADNGFAQTLTFASGTEKLSTLILYTRKDASATGNRGSLNPDPQTIDGNNFLGKVVIQPDKLNTIKLVGEFFDRTTDTRLDSTLGPIANVPGGRLRRQTADDYARRWRTSLVYNYTNPDQSFQIESQLYYQDAEAVERGEQLRQVGTSTRRRITENQFLQSVFGGAVQLQNRFKTGSLDHRLTYGFDLLNTQTSRPRDNVEFNLTARTVTKNVGGELFPNKTFPDTDTLRLGLFLQDEIELAQGRLTLIPGIRFDYYNLKPQGNDADFDRINLSNYKVSEVSDSAVSPKLSAIWKVTPTVSLVAQYARGFRSPPYDDAAIAFTNFAQGYTVLPNADLKSETSSSFEAGVRVNTPRLNLAVTGFYNRYKDFIDTVQIGTTRIGNRNFLQFQSQNINGAEIYGAEAKAEYRFSGKPEGFSLFASLAYSIGNNLETDQPLDSINPFKSVFGLRYQGAENRWGVQLFTTVVAKKDRLSDATVNVFRAPAFATVDLLTYYNVNPNLTLNLGVFNLFNKKYWEASDVRGLSSTDRNLDRYTQPGINVSASMTFRF
jgi:hemoglobin/transferrin/lactoferrin receptor protein